MRNWMLQTGALAMCFAFWFANSVRAEAQTNRPPHKPAVVSDALRQDLLTQKFTTPGGECNGWGQWVTPFALANSGDEEVRLLNGAITIPPRSVVVHPGAERDVAVAWRSPIAGKVSVRGKVVHAHPSGGDGVSWAIVHTTKTGRRELAHGTINRGGSQAIPTKEDAAQLTALSVVKDDGVSLVIGRRESHACDSTVVELTVTETEGLGRVWDLAGDLVPDIQADNPHADSFGNATVWHMAAPKGATQVEGSLTTARTRAGNRMEAWAIATEDTKMTIGATKEGQLVVYELSNPAAGWNWTAEPSVFPLVDKASVSNTSRVLTWKFRDGRLDKSDGQKLTLSFVCDDPALELTSEWWARPGGGPVRHAMRIANRSNGQVTLFEQPTIQLDLSSRTGDDDLSMWTFHTDGGTPDRTGVYIDKVLPPFARFIRTHPNGEFIPYALFDVGGKEGVYVGVEWSYCRIAAAATVDSEGRPAGGLRVRGGEFENFALTIGPGETFEVPPGFVGAYKGDVDDAGNSLRKWLFKYSMPDVIRKDATYPKVQWNAFQATGDKPSSWNSVEAKYYPMIDDIAPLGFEEVMLDVGWWKGATSAPEPEGDPVDWPSGMAKAAEHAHKAGMRFGLYWNKGEEMATPEGRERRMAHIKRLYNEYHADLWRSDCTAGPVVGATYRSVKGFYAMLDQLYRELPAFQWEDCSGGGRIKDFGAMKRCVKIFMSDGNHETMVRQEFYDGSYAYPPAQLMGCVGYVNPKGSTALKFAFRSTSMGAPEWFLDAPIGGNGGPVWTGEDKAAVKAAVETYKTRIRPLVRNADLYHILPRPDGKNWDGMQYYDLATKKGVVYLFKPAAGTDTLTIRLRGVDPKTTYRVTFEDGTNPAVEKTGEELAKGIEITLEGALISELVLLEAK